MNISSWAGLGAGGWLGWPRASEGHSCALVPTTGSQQANWQTGFSLASERLHPQLATGDAGCSSSRIKTYNTGPEGKRLVQPGATPTKCSQEWVAMCWQSSRVRLLCAVGF